MRVDHGVLHENLGSLEETANLLEWCRRYQRAVPNHPPHVRYLLGSYQIAQTENAEAEFRGAWVASALHFLMAAEAVGARCDQFLPAGLAEHPTLRWDPVTVLGSLTRLAKQYLYIRNTRPGMARHARIDLGQVAWLTSGLVSMLFGQLEVAERRHLLPLEVAQLEAMEWRSA